MAAEKDGTKGNSKLFPIFEKSFRPPQNQLKIVQLNGDANPKKRKRTLLRKDPQGLGQSTLDAGQKRFGHEFCEECGLLFSPGSFEDEEEHRKAHIRIQNTFQLTLWKDANIIFNYAGGCQIIMVQGDKELTKVKGRMKDFLAWLDSELGAGYDPSGINKERIFLYTARTSRKNVVKILGCGIMEIPDPSKIICSRLVQDHHIQSSTSEDSKPSYEDENSENNLKVIIGVTRLWVDSGFQRQNIATNICEMMRFNSGILGLVVPKENVGILEPSTAGRAFMTAFTSGKGALYTYNFA